LPLASKNISSVSLQGSDPLNSGGPAFFAPLAVFRSHLAAFWIVTSLGLNWNVMVSRSPPRPDGVASYSLRAAFCICERAVSPDGDGGETAPPLELVRATALLMTAASRP
jgi:hypothetical protein